MYYKDYSLKYFENTIAYFSLIHINIAPESRMVATKLSKFSFSCEVRQTEVGGCKTVARSTHDDLTISRVYTLAEFCISQTTQQLHNHRAAVFPCDNSLATYQTSCNRTISNGGCARTVRQIRILSARAATLECPSNKFSSNRAQSRKKW